jgi:PAS domain S-box-containing protein
MTEINSSHKIVSLLDDKVRHLEIHYKSLLYHQKITADSAAKNIINNKKIIDILTKAQNASKHEKAILRKELYKNIKFRYNLLKKRGVIIIQFVFPNNKSFLRVHKPSKYGDDLSKVREDFIYTNKTKNISRSLVQGKVSHGFRNTYPIYNKEKYLGAFEITFSSDYLQNYLTTISDIHSHILIHKDIFKNKIWKLKDKKHIEYLQSSEHQDYMISLNDEIIHQKCIIDNKKTLELKKDTINNKMSNGEKFAIYIPKDSIKSKIISFYPIKNLNKTKVIAWIISYEDDIFIGSTKSNIKTVRVIFFLMFLLIGYFIYHFVKQKDNLDKEVKRKTKELIALNQHLEDQVKLRTKEQNQLLSLFDKGDVSLIKWRNDNNLTIDYASKNISKIFGYSYNEFINDSSLYFNLINKNDRSKMNHEINYSIKNKLEYFTLKPYRIITKDKKVKWLLKNTIIIKNENNTIINFLGYISDITELMEYRYNLEKIIKNKTKENLKQLEILQEQSKLASMGEMIGAISHQWRQPLNSINMSIQNLDEYYEDGLIDEEFIDKFIEKNKKTIQFMSDTIDNFRNFFRIDKKTEDFSIKKSINETLNILSAQLKNHNIDISLNGDDIDINGYKNEFQQVLLNIIINAKDAINEQKISNGKIEISIIDKDIIIQNNGGNIPSHIIKRVFEPYFTTKPQGKGTGIGLYMSQQIITNNFGGYIKVENTKDGAKFTIGL